MEELSSVGAQLGKGPLTNSVGRIPFRTPVGQRAVASSKPARRTRVYKQFASKIESGITRHNHGSNISSLLPYSLGKKMVRSKSHILPSFKGRGFSKGINTGMLKSWWPS